jgi:hypothetical protein
VAAKLLPDDQSNGLVSEVMRFNDGPVIERHGFYFVAAQSDPSVNVDGAEANE